MNLKRAIFLTLILIGMSLSFHNSEKRGPSSVPNIEKSVDLSIQPVSKTEGINSPLDLITKENIEKFIPANLSPTNDQQALSLEIETKMSQKIVDNIFNSSTFKKSAAGSTVEKIKKVTEKSMSIGSPNSAYVHTFKVYMRAIERNAILDYSGFFNSSIAYYPNQNLAQFSISKPLSTSTTLQLSNNISLVDVPFNSNLLFSYSF